MQRVSAAYLLNSKTTPYNACEISPQGRTHSPTARAVFLLFTSRQTVLHGSPLCCSYFQNRTCSRKLASTGQTQLISHGSSTAHDTQVRWMPMGPHVPCTLSYFLSSGLLCHPLPTPISAASLQFWLKTS